MNLQEEFYYRIDNDNGFDNKKLGDDLISIAKKHLSKQFDISGVRLSLPDEEAIENESYEYVDNHIYVEDGHDRRHETCRQWAFEAGAIWMKKQIKGNEV